MPQFNRIHKVSIAAMGLSLCIVFITPVLCSALPAIVQSNACNATTCAFSSPTMTGNTILAVGMTVGNGSSWTPTDSFSNVYVQDDRAGGNFGSNGTWMTAYRASSIVGGSTTVSDASGAGSLHTMLIIEVSGIGSFDVKNEAGNTFSGGSCNSAVTTTIANDLVLNFCGNNSPSTTWVAQSPWTGVISVSGGYSMGIESQAAPSTGTFTPNWSPSSVGGDYANVTIAYKAAVPSASQPSVTIITHLEQRLGQLGD